MTTRLMCDDSSSFKIRRSLITVNGFASDVDPLVKTHLDELNELLGKKIFPIGTPNYGTWQKAGSAAGTAEAQETAETSEALSTDSESRTSDSEHSHVQTEVKRLLKRVLTPKHIPKTPGLATSWAKDTLGDILFSTAEKAQKSSLSDYIDGTEALAQIKYSFLDAMQESWSTLTYNVRTVLEDYPFITDYLIAYAYHVKKVREIFALKNFITNNKFGTRRIADYAAVSAARSLIEKEQLKVDHYNIDGSDFVNELTASPILLSAPSFSKSVREKIEQFVFDRDEEKIIDEAGIGALPVGIKPLLIKHIQQSPVPITKDNAALFLPNFVLEIMKFRGVPSPLPIEVGPTESDFDVQFQDDTDTSIEISKPAVRCAAQLYHAMVLGDELDVFGAVAYLTNRRLLMQRRHQDRRARLLRATICRTTFSSNEFTGSQDRASAWTRTRPAERQMFYRQVFDQGRAQVPEGLPVNFEFKRLWKVLILESARYLERAQASMNPDSFVSRQNVTQAVEDLQYNLSTHCTGMATVMAPIADAELISCSTAFSRIQQIVQQVVPEGGTWKRVVDKLNMEQRKTRRANADDSLQQGQGLARASSRRSPTIRRRLSRTTASSPRSSARWTPSSPPRASCNSGPACANPQGRERAGRRGGRDMPAMMPGGARCARRRPPTRSPPVLTSGISRQSRLTGENACRPTACSSSDAKIKELARAQAREVLPVAMSSRPCRLMNKKASTCHWWRRTSTSSAPSTAFWRGPSPPIPATRWATRATTPASAATPGRSRSWLTPSIFPSSSQTF